MASSLYNETILALGVSIPHDHRLREPQGTSERRSPVCGSRVAVDVILDAEGRVSALGQLVRACALGRASASLMASAAVGRSVAELENARDALTAFLAGERADPGEWPGLDIFTPARDYPARHASIRLAFEAVAEAAARALEGRLLGSG